MLNLSYLFILSNFFKFRFFYENIPLCDIIPLCGGNFVTSHPMRMTSLPAGVDTCSCCVADAGEEHEGGVQVPRSERLL